MSRPTAKMRTSPGSDPRLPHSWRNSNVQIDLLIDRRDGVINICEMKYCAGQYVMTVEDDTSLANKKIE